MKAQVPLSFLQNLPKQSHWVVFVVVLGICTIAALFGDYARDLLRYEDGLIAQHDYWRLISAHFVHLGWSHFALNMIGFLALWVIYGGVFSAKFWLGILIVSAFGISFCFLQFDPSLSWYVGLSGVLHTILSVVLVYLLLQTVFLKKACFHVEDAILLVFLLLKLTYEQLVGAVPFTESGSGGPVVVNAHFYGAIIGCICALFLFKFINSELSK